MTYENFLNEMTCVLEPLITGAELGPVRREQHFLQYNNISHFTSGEGQSEKIRLGVYLKNLHQGDSELKQDIDRRLPTPNNLMLGQTAVTFRGETGNDYEYNVILAGRMLCFKVGKGRHENGGSRKEFEVEIDIAWGEIEHFTDNHRQLIGECYRLVLGLMPQDRQRRDGLFGRPCGGQGRTRPTANLDAPDSMTAGNPDEYAKEDDDGVGNQNARVNLMRNKIVFGAPGTGKSHLLNEEAKKSFTDANSERVTFYATYSYAQFVGSYKPVMKDVGGQEKISYEFVPGPFLRMLVNAMKNPDEKFLLIIEEINRANAAAVFGDMFQLLDRDAKGDSEYPVSTSEDVRRYLVEKGLGEDAAKKVRIPDNLYIWATMNSADQGVFPLDTAFKRRWSFQYIGIDDGENSPAALSLPIRGYAWKTLRKFLNCLLVLNGVNEDKLMGPFFLKDATEFDSKVLMYLWEDAARMCRRAVFGEIKTYSDLCAEWKEKGIKIFDGVKFDDAKLTNYRASLQPGDIPTPKDKDGAATSQETNNG